MSSGNYKVNNSKILNPFNEQSFYVYCRAVIKNNEQNSDFHQSSYSLSAFEPLLSQNPVINYARICSR